MKLDTSLANKILVESSKNPGKLLVNPGKLLIQSGLRKLLINPGLDSL
jgi:hypothetical protein